MKKMNNKGFSLVELIIVIAIMAILAGAIAPALIRYIDKSRRSNDVSSADTIETSVNTALGTESISEYLTAADTLIELTPAGKFASDTGYTATGSSKAIKLSGGAETVSGWTSSSGKDAASVKNALVNELGQSLNGAVPKIKYKKDAKTGKGESSQSYYVFVTTTGAVEVYIAKSGKTIAEFQKLTASAIIDGDGGIYEICPEVCESYQ